MAGILLLSSALISFELGDVAVAAPILLAKTDLAEAEGDREDAGTAEPVVESESKSSAESDAESAQNSSSDSTDSSESPSAPRASLEPDPADDALPRPVRPGELTPSEVQQVRLRAAQLDQEATAIYLQGQADPAYQKWFRALRLLQYSDADEEIIALGQIGTKAWQDARVDEAQAIAQRLLALNQITDPQTKAIRTPEALEATLSTQENLALAHEQVGALDPAVERYEWLLEKNTELKRARKQEEIVDKLALLNMGRLNYPDATQYTQRQLKLLRDRPPRQQQPLAETQLLERLAYLQEQNRDWTNAITTQQDLLNRYSDPVNVAKRPALLVTIGTNQVKAGEDTAATQTYQTAYREAQAQQQYSVSHDALAQLAQLYQRRSQLQDALTVYEILRRVDELSYNLFGLLQTYEQMGLIHTELGDRPQATRTFEQALHIAQQIRYREAEIQTQLASLKAADSQPSASQAPNSSEAPEAQP